MMLNKIKTSTSKATAVVLALIMLLTVIPVGTWINAFAATVDSYTVTLSEQLDGVNITLTKKDDSAATQSAVTSKGVATFDNFVEEDVAYTVTVDEIKGFEDVTPVEFTFATGSEDKNTDVTLTALEKVTLTGKVVDEDGNAYSGAKVKISGYIDADLTTNVNGVYSVEAYKGRNYIVEAAVENAKYNKATTNITDLSDGAVSDLQLTVKNFNVNVSVNDSTMGTASVDNSTVAYGESANLAVAANEGYCIKEITVNGNKLDDASVAKTYNKTIEKITEETSIVVTFEVKTYKITFTVGENGQVTYEDGTTQTVEGGSVNVEKVFAESTDPNNPTSVNVTATPAENYRISKVVVDDNAPLVFTDNDVKYENQEFKMTKDHTLTVEFSLKQYDITVNNDDTKGTYKINSTKVDYDGSSTLTVTPNDGYDLLSVSVNGAELASENFSVNEDGTYSFAVENVQENKTVNISYNEVESATSNDFLNDDCYSVTFNQEYVVNGNQYIVGKNGTMTIAPKDPYVKVRVNFENTSGFKFGNTVTYDSGVTVKKIELNDINSIRNYKISRTLNAQFVVDTKAPTFSLSKSPDKQFNNKEYIITVQAKDDTAGVAKVYYATENDFSKASEATYDEASGNWTFRTQDSECNSYYYVWAVDKVNNRSNSKWISVAIDTTKPVVNSFNLLNVNVTNFGSFANDDVILNVVASDAGNVASGVKSITLKVNGKDKETKTGKNVRFTLTSEDCKNGAEISAVAVDEAGNLSEIAIPNAENSNVKSNKLTISSRTSTIAVTPIEAQYINNDSDIHWYKENGKVKVAVSDIVGIKTVKITVNGNEVVNENYNELDSVTTYKEYTVETKGNNPKLKNEIKVEVVNVCGVSSNASNNVYLDTLEPESVKVTFTSVNGSATAKVLNFLSFGLFCNQSVKITVDAADKDSGVKTIKLYKISENETIESATIESATTEVALDNGSNNTFTIDVGFDGTFAYEVIDNVGNTTGRVLVSTRNSNLNDKNVKGYVMLENELPDVSEISAECSGTTRSNTNNTVFSGDAEISFTAQDKQSGLASVELALYDDNIEKYVADYVKANENATENDALLNIPSDKLSSVVLDGNAVDTENADKEEHKYTANTEGYAPLSDGSYNYVVYVTDNAGNVSAKYLRISKDLTAPEITGFEFQVNGESVNNEAIKKGTVIVDDYGFYFKESTKVIITAEDSKNDSELISGVSTISVVLRDAFGEYYTVNNDNKVKNIGKTFAPENVVAHTVNEKGEYAFNIDGDFKGQIYAYAIDQVGNCPANVAEGKANTTNTGYVSAGEFEGFTHPSGSILESENIHKTVSNIDFKVDENVTPVFTANDTPDLYNKDVPVTITVTDTYSGIRSIDWSVTAPQDTNSNHSGKVEINNDKSFNTESGWEVVKTESNLITKLSKTITVTNDSNNIVVNVTMTDRAGNSSTQEIEFSIDKIAPEISLTYDNNTPDSVNNTFFKADRTATITVKERNFNSELVKYAITNTDGVIPQISEWKENINQKNPDETTHTATITYSADGDYTFNIECTDRANNASNKIEDSFTIDKTMPTVSVSYDNNSAMNGNYYKADRTATVTIVEHNFDASRVNILGTATDNGAPSSFPALNGWTNNGDTHTATIAYTADSRYVFDIEFNDMAGNSIADYTPEEFVVDKTAPTLEISGVADNSANQGDVRPIVTYYDTNFNRDAVEINLSGANNGKVNYNGSYSEIENGQQFAYANFEKIQKVDDIYTLTAKLTDLAGNETTATIRFSANRFGSVYDLSNVQDILGKYLQNEQDIVFTETNVDTLEREGIVLKLIKNGTPTTLVEGVDYTVSVSGGNGQWSVYTYTVNKSLFAGDGRYSLSVYSKDAAGNVNENIDETKQAEISFGIDKTAPIITPVDLADGKTYAVETQTFTVEIKDNLVLSNVKIYVDGVEVPYEVNGDTYTFNVSQSNNRQTVKIVATDAAGVEHVEEYDILVSTNLFVRWYNNTPLFIGSIVFVVLLVVAIVVYFLFGRKKKKEDENK